ncbi:MAG: GAF domain-containing protein [Gammaproteobacteria bacterium]|nr:GAF domain-containing protein [Gammaproteobacteria bacterium]
MDKRLLARCESEALHLSAAIQPHGTLLVVAADGSVSHVADNIHRFLGTPPESWLGQPLPPALAALTAEAGLVASSRHLFYERVAGVHGPLDALVSRGKDGECVLELVPHVAEHSTQQRVNPPVPVTVVDEGALSSARQRLVEEVAELTGFQRIMFYLFREDGDGEVVAEARQGGGYGSYLGLRFPASDIPQIARALYLKNPWRMIPNASAPSVTVLSRDGTPPDLTWSDMRSVSPVHAVYLGNMGVAASLSFPVAVNGILTALVAAHHSEPSYLSLGALERVAACVRAHVFAFVGYQSQRRMRFIDSLPYRFAPVEEIVRRHGDLHSCWPELANWLQNEFRVDGAVLCIGEETLVSDLALTGRALEAVDDWFCLHQNEFVATTDCLSRQLSAFPLSEVAGVMALRLRGRKGDRGMRLYLTRSEHVHDVAWGGHPDKPVELHDGSLGIAPRRSFEKWIEKRLGYSRPWDNEVRLLALKLRDVLQQENCV